MSRDRDVPISTSNDTSDSDGLSSVSFVVSSNDSIFELSSSSEESKDDNNPPKTPPEDDKDPTKPSCSIFNICFRCKKPNPTNPNKMLL
jgi:hypothetical protein